MGPPRISHRGHLVKVHPRQPAGRRATDPDDLPAEKTVYAMRDVDKLLPTATSEGEAIGRYAAPLLEVPLPWTRMRSVGVAAVLVAPRVAADRVGA